MTTPLALHACCAPCSLEPVRLLREEGFAHVSTTLVVSPYQLFDVCHDVLGACARREGLEVVWRDFRPYYPEATDWSRELGMYRQNYCGCRFSAVEAVVERHERRDERKRERELRRRQARA